MDIAAHIDRLRIRLGRPFGKRWIETSGDRSYTVYSWNKRPGPFPEGLIALFVRAESIHVASPKMEKAVEHVPMLCRHDPEAGTAIMDGEDMMEFAVANLTGTLRVSGPEIGLEFEPMSPYYEYEPTPHVRHEYIQDHIRCHADMVQRVIFSFSRVDDAVLFALRFGV